MLATDRVVNFQYATPYRESGAGARRANLRNDGASTENDATVA